MTKELEALEKINIYLNDVYDYKEIKEEIRKDINTIKQALLKSQDQEKVIEIIKEKLDFHGNEDYSIIITEKGKLDDEKSPKLIIKTNKEQYFSLKEVLGNE